MKTFYGLLLLTLFGGISISVCQAQVQASGYIRNYNAVRTLPSHEIITGRNRAQINLKHDFAQGSIWISNDIQNLYSAFADSLNYRLKEAYINLYFSRSDLRIGKQIITWGRAEGSFITDILSPVDISEFLTQDFSDLRTGVNAIKYTHYFGSDYAQLVVNPVFAPNKLPDYGNRWFPTLPINTSLPVSINKNTPKNDLTNIQLAARYAFRSNLNYDLDLGLLYWHYPNPSYYKELNFDLQNGFELSLSERYTPSAIAMYSGEIKLSDKLLLTSESAFYRRKNFDYFPREFKELDFKNPGLTDALQIGRLFAQNDDGFLKEKPWLISMVGLQYPFFNINISAQFINEHIFEYDKDILQYQDFYYCTLRLQRSFLRDTFRLLAFSRYNFRGQDFWINPEITYTGIDSFEASIGTQLFGGAEPGDLYGHVSFHSYAPNSFAYLKLSAYF